MPATFQPNDKLLVNRGGISHQAPFSDLQDSVQGPLSITSSQITDQDGTVMNGGTPVAPSTGDVLTVAPTAQGAVPPYTYVYEWRRNGSSIGAPSNASYTVVAADVGSYISVLITVSDSDSPPTTASAESDPTGTVTLAVPNTPSIVTPADNSSVDGNSFTLTSTAIQPAGQTLATTQFQVSAIEGDFSSPLIDQTVSSTSYAVVDAVTNGTLAYST